VRAADWVAPDRYEIRRDGRRFEEWEQDYAGKIGLTCAIEYALEWGVDSIWERVRANAERLRSLLEEIDGVTVHDPGAVRCGIVTFAARGASAQQVKAALAREQINVSVSPTTSAVIDALERELPDLVRAERASVQRAALGHRRRRRSFLGRKSLGRPAGKLDSGHEYGSHHSRRTNG